MQFNGINQASIFYCLSGTGNSPPKVTIRPPLLDVNVGDLVEFHCEAEGYPPPQMEWTRGPGQTLNPESSSVNGMFQIPSVKKSDEGEYFCLSSNSEGQDSKRTFLYVTERMGHVPSSTYIPDETAMEKSSFITPFHAIFVHR